MAAPEFGSLKRTAGAAFKNFPDADFLTNTAEAGLATRVEECVDVKPDATGDRVTAEGFEAEALPHMNELFRTAVRLTLNRDEAEDLVQEVFMQAWKSFDRYEAGTNCRAWLFKILFNKLDHQRRRKYAHARVLTECDELIAETVAFEPQVSPHLTDEEVIAALERLPRRFREVVLLADVEEFSYREAAQILGVPIGTVMSRLSRARAQLRALLAPVAPSYGIKAAARDARLAAQA